MLISSSLKPNREAKIMRPILVLAFLWIGACGQTPTAAAIEFELPIACAVGEECLVQNYADTDSGANAADPMCGPLTYNDHDGLDIRPPLSRVIAGIDVVAPAGGVVSAVRANEPDGVYARTHAITEGRECGNGVVIDHADGWTSQVCHLRAQSLRVSVGQQVRAGDVLGQVGSSGFAAFPHVHLALRHNGERVDPLTGAGLATIPCSSAAARPGAHWSARARTSLAYRGAQLLATGFASTPPAQGGDIEALPPATANGAALLFWTLAVGPQPGDVIRVQLFAPDGSLIGNGERVQDRAQAQAWTFAGRRSPPQGWPPGVYRGAAQLLRNGQVVSTRTQELTLQR